MTKTPADAFASGEYNPLLVSVYLPTRNRVANLTHAVESVLSQTYDVLELIVIDDASTDDTAEFLRQRAGVDRRLRVIRNPTPRGAPASRNTAIVNAKGAFVTGLDDDDEFLPPRIEAFVEFWNRLAAKGIKPSCLYAQEVWTKNGVPYRITRKRSVVTASDLFEENFIGNQIFAPRSHFIEAGLFDDKLPAWQDLEFFMRVLKQHGRAYLVDKATYSYDATPRGDRISEQPNRVRKAFELIAAKHAAGDVTRARALFLLIFQSGYKIPPGFADWTRFLRWGGRPKGILRLLRATVGNRLRRVLAQADL
ncbi:MAG TPA: glycosyltransferase [Candidatus Acidoferrales bacterium]|nr:glycosyltransferase [Candidatus Acidoferrales bacterium]